MNNKFLRMFVLMLFIAIFMLSGISAQSAKQIRILFVGNSYTYAGGSETDPGLPRYLKEMAAFYHKQIEYDFVVKGGTTLERQWNYSLPAGQSSIKCIETSKKPKEAL